MNWYIGINGQIGEGDKKLDGMLIEEVWVGRVPENLHGCCRC